MVCLPPEPDTEQMWEGLRGRVETDGPATVLATPAHLYDVNFGDRVKRDAIRGERPRCHRYGPRRSQLHIQSPTEFGRPRRKAALGH